MVGGIAKPRLFREFRPDARALAVIARCGTLRDDVLLRALALELESEGIRIVESTLYLQEIVPSAGVLSARSPTPEEWADIHFGFRAAKVIGQFDIGQSVVVRGSAVVAVEGIEGTDATIRRAGQLVNGDIVVVKACKPTQDLRFDLPAVGPETIRTIAEVRGRALAIEAGRTIILDRQEMLALADKADIAVVAVNGTGRSGMRARLRAAVVGVGHLGRFHAEKYAAHPEVQLAAVVDIDAARARAVGEALGVAGAHRSSRPPGPGRLRQRRGADAAASLRGARPPRGGHRRAGREAAHDDRRGRQGAARAGGAGRARPAGGAPRALQPRDARARRAW